MKIGSQRDFFAGLFMAAVGGAFAIGSTRYNFGVAAKPGPGYFPFGLGVILVLLGLVILAGSLARRDGQGNGEKLGGIPWRPLLCIVGALGLFGLTLPRLGFVISFPLMIVVTAYASTEFRWKEALFNAAFLTVFSYFVFIAGLKLNIPLWPA